MFFIKYLNMNCSRNNFLKKTHKIKTFNYMVKQFVHLFSKFALIRMFLAWLVY